jgi:adenosylcobinamide kinase/adenosylcobinamide-phosphate guanylyltransferase
MGTITLITGGARSGKSAHALALASESGGDPKQAAFIATAEPLDDEMRARIAHHRAMRPREFETIEESLKIADAIRALDGRATIVIVDCLTLWVSNLMQAGMSDDEIFASVENLAQALERAPFPSVIVTGEVGSGIVPNHPTARRFRDLLGWTNQKIAARADSVLMMVAGLPMRVK